MFKLFFLIIGKYLTQAASKQSKLLEFANIYISILGGVKNHNKQYFI